MSQKLTKEQILNQLTDVVNENPTLLNDVYFIHLKESQSYKQLPETDKENIDYLFYILNDSLLNLQGV